MKTVYIVIEASGEYEDYQERNCGAYFSQEKALVQMAKMKEAQERNKCLYELCQECPLNDWTLSPEEIQKNKEGYSSYCPYVKDITIDKYENCYCPNSYFLFEEATYFIKALEVEE